MQIRWEIASQRRCSKAECEMCFVEGAGKKKAHLIRYKHDDTIKERWTIASDSRHRSVSILRRAKKKKIRQTETNKGSRNKRKKKEKKKEKKETEKKEWSFCRVALLVIKLSSREELRG